MDPNKAIDFRADKLNVQGGKISKVLVGAEWKQRIDVTEGETLAFSCDWSANLVPGVGYWKTTVQQTLQVVFRSDDNTFGFLSVSIPAGTQLGSQHSSSSGLKVPSLDDPIPYEASSSSANFGKSYKGTTSSIKWTAKNTGKHDITCVIPKTGFDEPTLANNIAHIEVEVQAGPKLVLNQPIKNVTPTAGVVMPKQIPVVVGKSGAFNNTATVSPGAVAMLTMPKLAVIGANAAIQNNCEKGKPALIAAVTLKNTGGSLAANQGTIYLKEFGGANLSSAGVPLPAIAAGQSQVVEIPAISLQAYSELAGRHNIQVILNPLQVGGTPGFTTPASPYSMSASFPAGHCKTAQRQAPGRLTTPAR